MEKETILLSLEHLKKLGCTHIGFNPKTGYFAFESETKDFAANDVNSDLKIACETAFARFVKLSLTIEEYATKAISTKAISTIEAPTP